MPSVAIGLLVFLFWAVVQMLRHLRTARTPINEHPAVQLERRLRRAGLYE